MKAFIRVMAFLLVIALGVANLMVGNFGVNPKLAKGRRFMALEKAISLELDRVSRIKPNERRDGYILEGACISTSVKTEELKYGSKSSANEGLKRLANKISPFWSDPMEPLVHAFYVRSHELHACVAGLSSRSEVHESKTDLHVQLWREIGEEGLSLARELENMPDVRWKPTARLAEDLRDCSDDQVRNLVWEILTAVHGLLPGYAGADCCHYSGSVNGHIYKSIRDKYYALRGRAKQLELVEFLE